MNKKKNNNKNEKKHKTGIIFGLVFILVFVLAGCRQLSPYIPKSAANPLLGAEDTQYPTIKQNPNEYNIHFPGGSTIIFEGNAHYEIISKSDLASGFSNHEIILYEGIFEIESNLPKGNWFEVTLPNNIMARVTGSVMIIGIHPNNGLITMLCTEGNCEFINYEKEVFSVLQDNQGCLSFDGTFFGPYSDIENESLLDKCIADAAIPVATNTPSPSPTEDIAATATAACQEFEAQFPGTPCP